MCSLSSTATSADRSRDGVYDEALKLLRLPHRWLDVPRRQLTTTYVTACQVHLLPGLDAVARCRSPAVQGWLAGVLRDGCQLQPQAFHTAVATHAAALLSAVGSPLTTVVAVAAAGLLGSSASDGADVWTGITRLVASSVSNSSSGGGNVAVSTNGGGNVSGGGSGGGGSAAVAAALLSSAAAADDPVLQRGPAFRLLSSLFRAALIDTTPVADGARLPSLRALALCLQLTLTDRPECHAVVDALTLRLAHVLEELAALGTTAPPAALLAALTGLSAVVARLPWSGLGRLSECFKRVLVSLRGVFGVLDLGSEELTEIVLGLCTGLVAVAGPAATATGLSRHVADALSVPLQSSSTSAAPAAPPELFVGGDDALSVGLLARAVLSGLFHASDRCGSLRMVVTPRSAGCNVFVVKRCCACLPAARRECGWLYVDVCARECLCACGRVSLLLLVCALQGKGGHSEGHSPVMCRRVRTYRHGDTSRCQSATLRGRRCLVEYAA